MITVEQERALVRVFELRDSYGDALAEVLKADDITFLDELAGRYGASGRFINVTQAMWAWLSDIRERLETAHAHNDDQGEMF